MAVTADKPAPYATPSAIMQLIERARDRGLPNPVTAEVLGRAGISEGLISRTLQALTTLDLIDAEGHITKTFESLRLAPTSEYQQRLKEWLNGVYADVLSFVDPATDDEIKVRDAFRSYQPAGQQSRMVALFLGLYAAAGVKPEKSAPRLQRPAQQRPRGAISKSGSGSKNTSHVVPNPTHNSNGLPAPLAGLLSRLPDEKTGWTQADRNKFLTTFGTLLDFCFPIVSRESLQAEADEDSEE